MAKLICEAVIDDADTMRHVKNQLRFAKAKVTSFDNHIRAVIETDDNKQIRNVRNMFQKLDNHLIRMVR